MGFGFQVLGFRVQGSGFRVQGSGFEVQGSGFRVKGLRTVVVPLVELAFQREERCLVLDLHCY